MAPLDVDLAEVRPREFGERIASGRIAHTVRVPADAVRHVNFSSVVVWTIIGLHEEAGAQASVRECLAGHRQFALLTCSRFDSTPGERGDGPTTMRPYLSVKSTAIGHDGLLRYIPPLGTCRFGRFLRPGCGRHTPEVPIDGNMLAPPALAHLRAVAVDSLHRLL